MPEKRTIERARAKKRAGKAPTTQAGEFVREEIEHVRQGKHGARSPRQAIAIGLSKARRAGVPLKPKKGASAGERRKEERDSGGRARGPEAGAVEAARAGGPRRPPARGPRRRIPRGARAAGAPGRRLAHGRGSQRGREEGGPGQVPRPAPGRCAQGGGDAREAGRGRVALTRRRRGPENGVWRTTMLFLIRDTPFLSCDLALRPADRPAGRGLPPVELRPQHPRLRPARRGRKRRHRRRRRGHGRLPHLPPRGGEL